MAFTDDQKNQIRRFCGYYVFGSQPIQTFGWRFTNEYGHLEFLMNNLTLDQEAIAIDKYLTPLLKLETDILGVSDNMDTKQAAVWHWNEKELRDRRQLFEYWSRRFCGYLGVAYGPDLLNGNVSFVV